MVYIQERCHFLFNNSISVVDSFKYRYHEHLYPLCRLLGFNNSIPFDDYWKMFIKSFILDIIVVSCHYSTRFLSSDNYIINFCNYSGLQDYTFYLKDRKEEDVIDDFIKSHLIISHESNKLNITWENMYFLWKEYIQMRKFPNFLFKENLKINLIKKIKFDSTINCFLNISSKYLKYVQFFMLFWNEVISDSVGDDFEIDELCLMYKDWLKQQYPSQKCLRGEKMLSLIQHFYPDYIVQSNKYILNISSILWNKENDIIEILNHIKKKVPCKGQTLYKMYELYCNYAKHKPFTYIVSKKYFEKKIHMLIPMKFFSGDVICESYWKS